jgi:hypothetical protein
MTLRRLARHAAAAGLVLAAGAAAPALALEHSKALLAHTPSGGQPNAPAVDPAISGDGRMDRFAAYSSAATDIVPGSGPYQNIFLVKRDAPITRSGTPWRMGPTLLVSKGVGGPANGDSWDQAFDGYDYASHGREYTVAPKCLAFVSTASNLVNGDANGHADVFLERLANGRLRRIATPGAASEVALDGRCWTMAYVANGTVYRLDLRHRGRAHRISGPGGSSSPQMSANGKITTFARNGVVYVNRVGEGGTHRVAAGTAPTADEWGRYVAYEYNGGIWKASTKGAAHAGPLAPSGMAPSMTAGGSFVFYLNGATATSNVYRDFGTCPAGDATSIAGSPHGNYAAFGCSSGELYLSYIGPR